MPELQNDGRQDIDITTFVDVKLSFTLAKFQNFRGPTAGNGETYIPWYMSVRLQGCLIYMDNW